MVGLQAALGEAEAGDRSLGRKGFDQAVDALVERYVEAGREEELYSRGLRHMAAGLDPHSHYLDSSARALARARAQAGAEAGVVTRFMKGVDQVEIVAVAPGGPAAAAGVRPGDRLRRVRGRDVKHFVSNAEVSIALAGKPGETIELAVARPGFAPRELSLRLEPIGPDELVESRVIHREAQIYAYVHVSAFRRGVGKRVLESVAHTREAAGRLDGVVLDLRGNPGGELDEALVVLDAFVDEGLLMRTRGRGGRILREERAHAPGSDTQTPLVVLQDERSASAAELVAMAFQDHKRAQVIGRRSHGKGSVQEVMGLRDGSALTFTIARYHGPSDRRVDGQGVEPDVALASAAGSQAVDRAVDALSK